MSEPTLPNRRLLALDILRGLVIALMALDHSRDFFGDLRLPVDNPETTSVGLYLTRWITHFCAPTFVFLAGLSAWLYGRKVEDRGLLSWFLFTRGVWLLVIDHTVVYMALAFSVGILPSMFLVLSAIGVSMICLSAICQLPTLVVLGAGLAIILCHNLLDPISIEPSNWFSTPWLLIHGGPGYVPWANLEIGYPFLPWLGIMMFGFGLGPVTQKTDASRRWLIWGAFLVLVFFIGRTVNKYGDPRPWKVTGAQTNVVEESNENDSETGERDTVAWQDASVIRTGMSFLRVQKYPPSLLFSCMTLGPMLIFLGLIWKLQEVPKALWPMWIFGRVPLFFYITHFYILHAAAIVVYFLFRGVFLSPFQEVYSQMQEMSIRKEYGFDGLWQVYLAWICLLLVMLPLCSAFGELKRRSDFWLWKYL